jgi:hypothetical protein
MAVRIARVRCLLHFLYRPQDAGGDEREVVYPAAH